MKSLYILLIIPFLVACDPSPMNEATAQAFQECMAKGWVPDYFSNGGQISFECNPIPTQMNEEASRAFQQCLSNSEMNAIYTSTGGSVSCTAFGANVKIK